MHYISERTGVQPSNLYGKLSYIYPVERVTSPPADIKLKHMVVFRVMKKKAVFLCISGLLVVAALFALLPENPAVREAFQADDSTQWEAVLQRFFDLRDDAVLRGDAETLQSLYLTEERNGRWAYENELSRSKTLKSWAAKQGVTVLNIHSDLTLRSIKQVGRGYAFYVVASTLFEYAYETAPDRGERLPSGHVPFHRPDPDGDGQRVDHQPGMVRRPALGRLQRRHGDGGDDAVHRQPRGCGSLGFK